MGYKNFIQRMNMDIDTLSNYYMSKRCERYEKNVPLKGIKLRKLVHKLPLSLVKLDRKKETNENVYVINDERIKKERFKLKKINTELKKLKTKGVNLKKTKKKRPKIYACTHIGGNDIQRVFEAIEEHAYLFLGDPKGIYKDLSGLLLFLNGTINLETGNKTDRFIAKQRSIELLNRNGNLLIFPEGAWNTTSNLLVMDLYKGTVSMAMETGADIIPVAIEQYGDDFFVSIGKNMPMDEYKDLTLDELNLELRDKLATEKWNIIEKHHQKRDDLSITEEDFAQGIVDRCPYGFTVEDVEKTRYIDKDKIILKQPYGFVKQRQEPKQKSAA